MYVKEEITPKAERRSKDYESGEKPQRVLRSYRNKSFQSLNYNLVEDSGRKIKNYLGPVNNIKSSCKHTWIKEILSYASTAPRPILSSEASSPIIYEVSNKGTEFRILFELLQQNSKTLLRATKTYTRSLYQNLPKNTENIGFLSNSLSYSKIRILFLTGSSDFLQSISTNAWKQLPIDFEILLKRSLSDYTGKMALLCIASRESLIKTKEEVYSIIDYTGVAPAYLLTYN